MNRLLYLFLSLLISTGALAQSVSYTLTTPPCHNDGVLTANFTGLTPPITVNWHTYGVSSTTITHTITGMTDALTSYSGGPVYITATDGSGSAYNYYSGAPPFTYSVSTTPATCPTLGSATATVSGGTAPYTYSWFNTSTMGTVGTSNPISLAGGISYGVTITDAAGCIYGSMVSDSGFAIYSIPTFSVNTTTTPANCTNGTATVTSAPGSVAPLSYLWSTGATTAGISGLVMGSYAVTVTDATGCTGSSYAYVSQAITISAPITPTPATCLNSDGAVIAFGSGGVPPYTYLWSNGATTASQTGLAAGYYGVTVTDANGCWGNSSAYVSTSTPITVSFTSTPSLCTSSTGTAALTPTGGTAPYTYLWYTSPVQTTSTATSLAPGTYNFKVTDAVGCVRTGTVTVPPVSVINASFMGTSPMCTTSTGAVAVTASGGVAPYTYAWNTGATTSSISSVPAGYYNVTITDAMSCHVNRYYTLHSFSPLSTAISSTPASCIFANDGIMSVTAAGGTTPYSYSWSGGGTTATVTGKGTGDYWVYVTDAMGCTASRYNHLGYNPAGTSCYCTISGTVYNDLNGNCVQDAGEAGINHIQILCSGGIGYTYTDAAGHYSFKVPSGSYTITETVSTFYPLSSCQTNNIPVTASAASGCVIPVNFANSIATIHDMAISTWNYNPPVPGNTYHQITVISNQGTVTEAASLAGYRPDGQLLAPSFVPTTLFSGSPYYYSTGSAMPSLVAGASQTAYANYLVPTPIPLGTSVLFKDTTSYTAPMSNWLTDYSPWDNTEYFNTVVVASYDPNFKEVSPKGTGPNGNISYSDSVLEYMVHFQNTGSWYAQNIVVIDTLDNDLEWTSLKPIYASANCEVRLSESGPYKIAKFIFNNINLPAQSMDDLRSNGMFTYKIRTKSGLPLGTQFTNRASIYFDYNEPILTNTTRNTIAIPSGVANVAVQYGSFVIYPNPASHSFNAVINSDANATAEMILCDVTGKVLMNKVVDLKKGTQTINTDASQLAPGLYFVTLNENGKIATQKLVIMK